jgi:hypothetical protein
VLKQAVFTEVAQTDASVVALFNAWADEWRIDSAFRLVPCSPQHINPLTFNAQRSISDFCHWTLGVGC